MTREQAIKEFESELEWAKLNIYPYISRQKIEANTMAIKALEKQPCEDAVSRKAVEDAIVWNDEKREMLDEIQKLPPVIPQPKTGHWYIDERPESDREVICSNCEKPVFKYHKLDFDYRPKYCPNCGVKMKGGD